MATLKSGRRGRLTFRPSSRILFSRAYVLMSDVNKSSAFRRWLRINWAHLVLAPALIAFLAWLGMLIRSDAIDKASWLLVPLTGIYGVLTSYMALAAFRSAAAADRSTLLMQESVAQLRLTTLATFSPQLTWPSGFSYEVGQDGTALIHLANLSDQPAFDLVVSLWELEDSQNGGKSCRSSSQRRSARQNVEGSQTELTVRLLPSTQTDEEKHQNATLAMQRFQELAGGPPTADALCVLLFSTKVSSGPAILVFELNKVDSLSGLKTSVVA